MKNFYMTKRQQIVRIVNIFCLADTKKKKSTVSDKKKAPCHEKFLCWIL